MLAEAEHTAFSLKNRGEYRLLLLYRISLVQSRSAAQGLVLPTSKMGLPTSTDITKIIFHRHSQRPYSQWILCLAKLIINYQSGH